MQVCKLSSMHGFKIRPRGSTRNWNRAGFKKNSQGFGPTKPGRHGGSTRNPADPGKPRLDPTNFFIHIEIKC